MNSDPGIPGLPPMVGLLSWESLHGERLSWALLREAVSQVDALQLLAVATHWNALFQDLLGRRNSKLDSPFLDWILTAERERLVGRYLARGGSLGPLVCRQGLLVLMRLALEAGSFSGCGQSVTKDLLFDLLLGVNDNLDNPVTRGISRRWPFGEAGLQTRLAMARRLVTNHDFSGPFNSIKAALRAVRLLDLSKQQQGRADSLDLEDLFIRRVGLPFERFWALSTSVQIRTLAPGDGASPNKGSLSFDDNIFVNFTPEALVAGTVIAAEEADRFLRFCSRPVADCAETLRKNQPENSNFLCFRMTPMLSIGRDTYRLIDRTFLAERAINAVFFEAREQLCLDAEASDRKRLSAVKLFGGWWGSLHEQDLDQKLSGSRWGAEFISQPLGGEQPMCDGLIKGVSWCLMEYKATLLAVATRNQEDALAIGRGVVKAFDAGRGTGTGARRGARGIPQLAEACRLATLQTDCPHLLYPVLVCLDPLISGPLIPALLRRRLAKALDPSIKDRVRPLVVLSTQVLTDMSHAGVDLFAFLEDCFRSDPAGVGSSDELAREKWLKPSDKGESDEDSELRAWLRRAVKPMFATPSEDEASLAGSHSPP